MQIFLMYNITIICIGGNSMLRKRQVHLDFHTSEFVPVGNNFSKDQFQNALKAGHVNSITVF